jgi:hypothetical protein
MTKKCNFKKLIALAFLTSFSQASINAQEISSISPKIVKSNSVVVFQINGKNLKDDISFKLKEEEIICGKPKYTKKIGEKPSHFQLKCRISTDQPKLTISASKKDDAKSVAKNKNKNNKEFWTTSIEVKTLNYHINNITIYGDLSSGRVLNECTDEKTCVTKLGDVLVNQTFEVEVVGNYLVENLFVKPDICRLTKPLLKKNNILKYECQIREKGEKSLSFYRGSKKQNEILIFNSVINVN